MHYLFVYYIFRYMRRAGFEPATYGLKVRTLPAELSAHHIGRIYFLPAITVIIQFTRLFSERSILSMKWVVNLFTLSSIKKDSSYRTVFSKSLPWVFIVAFNHNVNDKLFGSFNFRCTICFLLLINSKPWRKGTL